MRGLWISVLLAVAAAGCDDGSSARPVDADGAEASLGDAQIDPPDAAQPAPDDGAPPADAAAPPPDADPASDAAPRAPADAAPPDADPTPEVLREADCGDGRLEPGEFCPEPGRELRGTQLFSRAWAGDLDGDGDADLAYVSADGLLTVQRNDGRGAFAQDPIVRVQGLAGDVAAGDFDGDGDRDVAVALVTADAVQVVWQTPEGWRADAPVALAGQPFSVDAGDVDGDGLDDLMLANFSRGGASVLLGRADGALAGPYFFATGVEPHGAVLADADGDGALDIVTANAGTHDAGDDHVTINWGDGAGGFSPPDPLRVGNGPFFVDVGDLDGDGRPDLVAGNYGTPIGAGETYAGGDTISVLRGLGDRRFAPSFEVAAGDGPNEVRVLDVNADGRPDVLTADRGDFDFARRTATGGGTLTVLFGDGALGFPRVRQLHLGAPLTGLAAADFDGDGAVDLVAVVHEGRRVVVFRQAP